MVGLGVFLVGGGGLCSGRRVVAGGVSIAGGGVGWVWWGLLVLISRYVKTFCGSSKGPFK